MKAEVQANLQDSFALAALRAGVRVDGRPLDAFRSIEIKLGPAPGQAHVSLGRTVVLASATAEAVVPYPDRPSEGTISVSAEFSPAASEQAAQEFAVHGSNPASDKASVHLRGIIEKVIRESRALDTEALCILSGKKVWAVSVAVSVVDSAGNATDAAHLAAMAALRHARRNDVTISGTDVYIHPFAEREPVPLPIHHVPLTITFALFAATSDFPDDIAALDPSLQEEIAADGSLTIAVNAYGEVCGLSKVGGLPILPTLVGRCAHFAADHAIQVTRLLDAQLAETSPSHHPMAPTRPKLEGAPDDEAEMDTDDDDAAENGDDTAVEPLKAIQSGSSLWNAVPMEDDAPPSVPTGVSLTQPETLSRVPGSGVAEESELVRDVFRSAVRPGDAERKVSSGALRKASQQTHAGAGEAPSKQGKDRQAGSKDNGRYPEDGTSKRRAAVAAAAAPDDEDDDEDDSDDEDLMSAVISRPRGGGARSSQPRTNR